MTAAPAELSRSPGRCRRICWPVEYAAIVIWLPVWIAYQKGGFYSCAECIAVVVGGVRAAVAGCGH